MKNKRIIVSAISDLVSDQRVHRVCSFLQDQGFSVTLIGRRIRKSLPLDERKYKAHRIHCFFSKGAFKYAEFNFKLFLKILFKRTDIFLSNDLDTLLPVFVVSKLRRKKLVYDSHEYFTGMPELQDKPFKRKIWQAIEKRILPKIKYAYTVNQSIADLYNKETGIKMKVVRNTPVLNEEIQTDDEKIFLSDKTILLLQGTGINKDRGAEELIQSMQFLPSSFLLVFIGGGEIWEDLKKMRLDLKLEDKVMFIEKIPFGILAKYTRKAHLGFSLDKPLSLNYKLSLPNKIFDYIHAGSPILASDIAEVKNVIEPYKVGTTINEVTPQIIADKVLAIFKNDLQYKEWKKNTLVAAKELCWQKEQEALKEVFEIDQ